MTRVSILGVPVEAQRYEPAIQALLEGARSGGPRRAHFATVHSVVEATDRPALREAFRSAWMVCTDGVPLAWVARLRGAPAERVCGPDVMLSLCDRGRDATLRHYFLGGGPGTAERLAARLVAKFPGLAVVGTATPPFRAQTEDEDEATVRAINATSPDVVWVGLGSPKQELWAASHETQLSCHLILPVGAAFDFHSGGVPRAPGWMRRLGLEWLFRLAMEPRRLLRRYLVTNTRFVLKLAREELAVRIRRRGEGEPSGRSAR
jgi:N-acetylglucosaminyldiphosphoundecaprenol N-acetyl-beta-D-mannosaminyltransferase